MQENSSSAKNEKLGGRFVLGRGVTTMDLNMLSVSQG